MTDYKVAKALLDRIESLNQIDCIVIDNKHSYFAYNGRVLKLVSCLNVQPIEEPQDLREKRLVLESVACELAKLRKKGKLKMKDRQREEQLNKEYPNLEDQIRNMDAIALYLRIDQSPTYQLKRTHPPYPQSTAIIAEDTREQLSMVSHVLY